MFSRFDTIPDSDRQTDGQTRIERAIHSIAWVTTESVRVYSTVHFVIVCYSGKRTPMYKKA